MKDFIALYGNQIIYFTFYIGIVQALCTLWILKKQLKPKRNRYLSLGGLILLLALHDTFWSLYGYQEPDMVFVNLGEVFVYGMIIFLYLHMCFADKTTTLFKKVFAAECLFQLMGVIMTFPFYMIICNFQLEHVAEFMNTPCVFSVLYVLITYPIMAVLSKPIWNYLNKTEGKMIDLIMISFFIIDFATLFMGSWPTICILFILWVALLIQIFFVQNENEKRMKEQFAYYKELAEKQEKREQKIAVIRHDISNHLSVMQEMQKDEAGVNLLKSIDKSARSMTGNAVVDCLLREKTRLCEREGISFQKKGDMIGKTEVTDYELVSLFANLLDNAIEAAREAAQKTVTMTIEKKQGHLKIVVSNAKLAERQMPANGIGTTKRDKKRHGIGNRIIRQIVEKHEGRISYYDEGERMTVVVLMQL